ncbi:putative LPS assembly protein LptD [Sphingobacterium sp.]|uniref:putative LPS assembly protein LptD n=1 Tax=Sphingobacterium sp. TaxID=341027 RepID=UPI002897C777|nr:putative LPS assembly protein LptD [Sphingobacterium sp.]
MKALSCFFHILFFLLAGVASLQAQEETSLRRPRVTQDSTKKLQDSTLLTVDSTRNNFREVTGQDTVVMQDSSGLETTVSIVANDSSWNEVSKNILHLFKGAKVKYQGFELAADYIRLDRNTNVLFASGVVDHNGKYVGRPVVIMPGEAPIAVDSLLYNYKSQIPKTFGVMTEVDGGFIQAREVRKNIYDETSIYQGLYSTCNLPFPHTHFGIQITKGVITDKQIIAGPSYLVVENIPLKFLAIPFGFFPKQDKKSSGFLFPSFGEDAARGFSMRDLGWYLTFNDYWDTEFRGNLYSKGSWEASMRTQYLVNYKFNGNFALRYGSTVTGVEGTPNFGRNKDFNVTWNHTQRQEANPGTSFTASVNFGTTSYFRNTAANSTYDINQITNNRMGSSIAYGKVFADGKVNFTSSLRHEQDMRNGDIRLELPQISLNVSTFNPFDSKNRIGEQKWYQRITVGYSLQGRNYVNTKDSLLFKGNFLSQFTNGFQHNIPVSLSLNVLKYFQFNTSMNYTERWYFQSVENKLLNEVNGYSTVKDTIQGFKRAYDYSISSGLSTKVYGNFKRGIGKIQSMRHVMTPSINVNYRPDFGAERYGFYKDFIDENGAYKRYSIFDNAVYGTPSMGKSMGIGFSIDNTLEAKIRDDKDSTGNGIKKIPIIQGLTFSGNYNAVADSLKLSPISFSGRTSLFDQKININFNGSFDPYSYDKFSGRRIDRFSVKDGKLARLTNFGLSFDYSFNPKASKSRNNNIDSLRNSMPAMTDEQTQALARISTDPNAFVDFNIPWNLSGSFSFNYTSVFDQLTREMKPNITSTVNLHGDFNMTPKWKVQFNTGFDFVRMESSMSQISIYRDLHCWDMSVGWVPFGRYKSFNVTIRAKASILQDLKLTKRNSHFTY